MRDQKLWAIVLTCSLLVGIGACGNKSLRKKELYKDQKGFRIDEKAEIEDKTKNREVLNVVAQYQRAITNKEFGTLKRLIDESYYDNGGTTDTTKDDYGASDLPKIYELIAQHAESIQYKVVVKNLKYKRDRALVDYEYEYAYKYKVDDKRSWDAGVDVNRLKLVRKKDGWKIVSGL